MLPLLLAECDSCNTSSVADETYCALDSQHLCPFPVQHSEAHKRIHRNIKNSEQSERQASGCPSFRGGEVFCTFLKLQ